MRRNSSSIPNVRPRNRWWHVGVFLVPVSIAVVSLAVFVLWPDSKVVDPPPRPRARPRVKVVVDTSASMAGYFGGKTEFKDFLANFIATAPQLASRSDYYFPGEAGKPFERFNGDAQQLIAAVLNDQLPQGTNSMLQDVLQRLRDDISPGELAVLITDGIFSYSNAEVKKNPEINRDNLRGLAAQVQVVFDRQSWSPRKMTPVVSVLRYSSGFHGTYYTYSNQRLACCPAERPFYIWAVGNEPDVLTFVTAVKERDRLRPKNEALFGLNGIEPHARVLRYSNRSGRWVRNLRNPLLLEKVASPANEPLRFTLALDLAGLPADVLSPEYVKAHLQVDGGFATVELPRLLTRSAMQAQLDPNDADDLTGASHFLELRVRNLPTDRTSIVVSLLDALPTWCRQFDTNDDSMTNVVGAPATTFGLLSLMEGIANALRSGKPLLRFELVLER